MAKSKYISLKESARRGLHIHSTIGRPDRIGQYTHLVDELPRNLVVLAEHRKRKEDGEER